MSVVERPDCLHADACRAKGNGHCRGCAGAVALRRLAAEPQRPRVPRPPISEETRAKIRANILRRYENPEVRRAIGDQARSQLVNLLHDAEVQRKRREGISRALSDPIIKSRRIKALRAAFMQRTAKREGIPVGLVPLFRTIRFKTKAPASEVRAVVLASREAMALAKQEADLVAMRKAGPAPAIGTRARITWTRKVNGRSGTGASV